MKEPSSLRSQQQLAFERAMQPQRRDERGNERREAPHCNSSTCSRPASIFAARFLAIGYRLLAIPRARLGQHIGNTFSCLQFSCLVASFLSLRFVCFCKIRVHPCSSVVISSFRGGWKLAIYRTADYGDRKQKTDYVIWTPHLSRRGGLYRAGSSCAARVFCFRYRCWMR